jgi:hypothetical protein
MHVSASARENLIINKNKLQFTVRAGSDDDDDEEKIFKNLQNAIALMTKNLHFHTHSLVI